MRTCREENFSIHGRNYSNFLSIGDGMGCGSGYYDGNGSGGYPDSDDGEVWSENVSRHIYLDTEGFIKGHD